MDPSRVRAPYLPEPEIEEIVEALRPSYAILQNVPIDVLSFAEFDLELEFTCAPLRRSGQEAFLRPDRTGVVFDSWAFKEPSQRRRLRFSLAHELGHYYLHEEIYGNLQFTTVTQWIAFVDGIPINEYHWIERHADSFAGYLLMPTDRLRVALRETLEDANRDGFSEPEDVINYCGKALHGHFDVSLDAMKTRLRKSRLIADLRIDQSDSP